MRALIHISRLAALYVAVAPVFASAQGLSRALGLFNIFVGLMLTVALLTFAIGFVVWVVRLGFWPTYRTEGIKIMEWAVAILFVLIVLLMIVQFFQYHPHAAAYVVSTIVVLLLIGIVVYLAAHAGKKEEKAEPRRPPR